jgi:predicted ester cyclase
MNDNEVRDKSPCHPVTWSFSQEHLQMPTQINESIVRTYYEQALNAADWTMLEKIVAADFVDHEQLFNIPNTRAGLKQKYTLLRTGFPDLSFEVDDLFCAGDRVAVRATVRGTHTQPFLGRRRRASYLLCRR